MISAIGVSLFLSTLALLLSRDELYRADDSDVADSSWNQVRLELTSQVRPSVNLHARLGPARRPSPGAHQWIYPRGVTAAQGLFAQHPTGIIATAWKLFNRGWLAAAEAYRLDTLRYPNHPRHFGRDVVPLVDEDGDSQQIGWVRINQYTKMDHNFAVFVQFTLLDVFEPRPLPAEYA